MFFKNRFEAGEKLADAVLTTNKKFDCVFGIPRGGIPVAARISNRLGIPLRTIVAKKIGHPEYPEYAIGAVCVDEMIVEPDFQKTYSGYIQSEYKRLQNEVLSRARYQQVNPNKADVKAKSILLVDDGAATGYTLLAAIRALKKMEVGALVVSVPVLPRNTADKIRREAELVCLEEALYFNAVGNFYEEFDQVSDVVVESLLTKQIEKSSKNN